MCVCLLTDASATRVRLLGGVWPCGEDYSFPSCQWLASSLLLKQKISDGSRLAGGGRFYFLSAYYEL